MYLDQQRTHEVHATLEPRSASEFLFSTTELPAGSHEASEAVTEEVVLSTADQLRSALTGLEERLALQGTYYRAEAPDMRWQPLAPVLAAKKLDLRAHEVPLGGATNGARLGFHHFHAGATGRDTMLVTVPRIDLDGRPRSILAELEFEFPNVDEAEIRVLHTRLLRPTLQSQLVKQHVELPTRGYAKLVEPKDYATAFGAGWLDRTRETFRIAASRALHVGRERREPPEALHPRPEASLSIVALVEAIESDRVQRLRERFLTQAEARSVVAGGELSIRRYVQTKQRRADHRTAFDLSVLLSALLVEYGLQANMQSLLDEEGAKLLRYCSR